MNQWIGIGGLLATIIGVGILLFKMGRWTGVVDGSLSAIKDSVATISSDIKEIFRRLPATPAQNASPQYLTEFGEKISKCIDAKEWTDRVISELLPEVEGKEPFEVDLIAHDFVDNTSDLEMAIARCAFECGTSKENVQLVLNIVLREALLERRSE